MPVPPRAIAEMCQGNPGALQTLLALKQIAPENFFHRLHSFMDYTRSQPSDLWRVFKDKCNYDGAKSVEYLEEWMENSQMPLGTYIDS